MLFDGGFVRLSVTAFIFCEVRCAFSEESLSSFAACGGGPALITNPALSNSNLNPYLASALNLETRLNKSVGHTWVRPSSGALRTLLVTIVDAIVKSDSKQHIDTKKFITKLMNIVRYYLMQ